MGSQDARPRCMVVEPGRFGERCILDDRHEGPHEFFIPEPPVAVPDPAADLILRARIAAEAFPGAKVSETLTEIADLVDALLVERQQHADFVRAYDCLDDALDNLLDYLKIAGWKEQEDRNVKAALTWAERVSGYFGRCNTARAALVAVDKEADRD